MTTRLSLDAHPITLHTAGRDPIPLPLSLQQLLDEGLAHFPPGESAIEQAIATTEEALMPKVTALRAHPLDVLVVDGTSLAAMPTLLARQPAPTTWTLDDIERAFNLLADVAAGLPAHRVGLPEQPYFVAALVVVRELMHHVGWPQLRLT